MSLSATLSNALSGLTLASRGTQVVSSNVANAATEGYGRRVIEAVPVALNGASSGVRVASIRRDSDPLVIAERRLAQADAGLTRTRSEALDAIETALGSAEDGDGLSARIASFESALVDAASSPDSTVRLSAVLAAAQDVTAALNDASARIQSLREAADRAITSDIEQMNSGLARIAQLNSDIVAARVGGRDANALLDQRQALIDSLSEIVPLRECARDNGAVALYTASGATLLDGRPATLDFSAAGVIVPEMSVASGALSIPTLNGTEAAASGAAAPLAGGRLEALFAQRDALTTAAQADLDALAETLVQSFSDTGLDPTIAAGAAGLFVDSGAAVAGTTGTGLAARIAINAAVDPNAGGALWRLRDGVGAATAGAVGDATLLSAMAAKLTSAQTVPSGTHAGLALSIQDLASETANAQSSAAARADQTATAAAARLTALQEAELSAGVDTDQELQMLLQYENLYAANARVLQVADDMFETLLGI